MIRVFVIVLLFAGAVEGWGQSGARRQAMRSLGKEKWQKSRSILEKALRKDSTASSIHYGFSCYYFTPSNPAFDIDSAYMFINKALEASAISPISVRKKRAKDDPDSATFLDLRQRIDSAAFARARLEHSELSYNFFIDHFHYAAQLDTARLLRDEVAWQALDEDSPDAFAEYIKKYPSSRYAGKARARQEELLFRINTKDQRLSSFESFLSEYPGSPYRHLVEEQILEIFTADGSAEKFSAFLRRHPRGNASRKARDILFHLTLETEHTDESFSFWTDSLRQIQHLNAAFLVPFMAGRKFGFMDASGKEIIAATSASLYEGYRCGNIREDILVHDSHIISRDGTVIFQGRVTELSDLGYGFVGIETADCYRVLHKSGFAVGKGCAKDAAVIDGRFVAVLGADQWSVYSLAGRLLTSGWEEVRSVGGLIALRKGEEWSLVTTARLGMVADQQPLEPGRGFDDIREWSHDLTWARRGSAEAVMDEHLRERIPFAEHELRREIFGIVSRSADCLKLIDREFNASSCIDDVKFNSSWVCVKQKEGWSFYDFVKGARSGSYDSITFIGIFAAAHHSDTVRVFFNDTTYRDFTGVDLSFIPGHNAGAFLQAERGNKKTIYDHTMSKLFDGYYDRIQHAGDNYFIVDRKEKKGLINSEGKQILPFAYDAIGEIEGTRVQLLRSMRFGLYDVVTKKEIRPGYDKNILPYNKELFVGSRKGKSGIVDFNNRVHIPFLYDGLRFWNDTSALARKNNVWSIIDLGTNEVLIGDIHDYSVVADSGAERIVIIRRGSEFGVLSSTRGEVIPVSYTDLVNIGPAGDPLYFAEKHVREAFLSMVFYYDADGNPIRHQMLEPDDFDAIYCEGN